MFAHASRRSVWIPVLLSMLLAMLAALIPLQGSASASLPSPFNPADMTTGVRLTDTLPLALLFASVTASQGACVQPAGALVCTLGALGVGHRASITVLVRASAAGDVTNSVEVAASERDPILLNNLDAAHT